MVFYVLGKVCAFLGNNYDKFWIIEFGHHTPVCLKARIRQEIINLIKNEDVDTFLVVEIGGYEENAYDEVLSVQNEYPKIRIYLVISQMRDLHETGDIYRGDWIERRVFDDFILPLKCEFGYKKLPFHWKKQFF